MSDGGQASDMRQHVNHRIRFTPTGPERGTLVCLDCDVTISTGQTIGRADDVHVVTGKLLAGGAVVDGVDIPSTFTLLPTEGAE